MTEPTLEPGETWESRLASLLRHRDEVEIAHDTASPWEREWFRAELERVNFQVGCVIRNLDAQGVTVDW